MFDRKNINKAIPGLFILFLIFGNVNSVFAKAVETPEQSATSFYKWYMNALNQNRDPRTRQKRKLLSFLSKRFGKWVYSIPDEEYGADVFIDAQDFDEEWARSVSSSKAVVRGNNASLTITLGVFENGRQSKGIGKHILRLKMVKEDGLWKIDHINDY